MKRKEDGWLSKLGFINLDRDKDQLDEINLIVDKLHDHYQHLLASDFSNFNEFFNALIKDLEQWDKESVLQNVHVQKLLGQCIRLLLNLHKQYPENYDIEFAIMNLWLKLDLICRSNDLALVRPMLDALSPRQQFHKKSKDNFPKHLSHFIYQLKTKLERPLPSLEDKLKRKLIKFRADAALPAIAAGQELAMNEFLVGVALTIVEKEPLIDTAKLYGSLRWVFQERYVWHKQNQWDLDYLDELLLNPSLILDKSVVSERMVYRGLAEEIIRCYWGRGGADENLTDEIEANQPQDIYKGMPLTGLLTEHTLRRLHIFSGGPRF